MVQVLQQNDSEDLDLSYRTEFVRLIQQGAGSQDIHGSDKGSAYAGIGTRNVSDKFVARELRRPDDHKRSMLPILEPYGKMNNILDVGCGTGGTTLALALSRKLNAKEVHGVDMSELSLKAARVRAKMYRRQNVEFRCASGTNLSYYEDDSFELVTSVSVLEFVPTAEAREQMIREMQRVTMRGGYIYLTTPSPWWLLEYHSRRILGDFRPMADHPWASSPSTIKKLFADGYRRLPVFEHRGVPPILEGVVQAAARWQKFLYQKQ